MSTTGCSRAPARRTRGLRHVRHRLPDVVHTMHLEHRHHVLGIRRCRLVGHPQCRSICSGNGRCHPRVRPRRTLIPHRSQEVAGRPEGRGRCRWPDHAKNRTALPKFIPWIYPTLSRNRPSSKWWIGAVPVMQETVRERGDRLRLNCRTARVIGPPGTHRPASYSRRRRCRSQGRSAAGMTSPVLA
jgi:hypothetical protein